MAGASPAMTVWSLIDHCLPPLCGDSFVRLAGGLLAGGLAAFGLRGAFGFGGGVASDAAVSTAALRGFAAARFLPLLLPPRALLASNRPTACSSVIVSGARSEESVALTPSWLA